MMIRVMYNDGRYDLVKQPMLDLLLAARKLTGFLRTDGWAIIGRDRIRGGALESYGGPERRGG
jgi:hypothetical protein